MISLIHPSRGRPQKARDTLDRWWQHYMRGHHFEHILSIDYDDPEKEAYLKLFPDGYHTVINDNTCVVQATNVAAVHAHGDILVYLSDDFDCPDGWVELVNKEFEGVTGPMLLKVDDCLQRFEVGVVTIPIMNLELFHLLGYFWHPGYRSMHVDVDLYETCKRIGAIKYAPHLKFPHNHYSNGKAPRDETYTRSEANWNQGLDVINRRRRQGFPVAHISNTLPIQSQSSP